MIKANIEKDEGLRVNCIGMGDGASQELVEGAAKAGLGTYALISDISLVEEKTVACMQRVYMPKRKLEKIYAYPVDQKTGSFELKADSHWLENDKQISLKFLEETLPPLKQLELHIRDPNTNVTEKVAVPVTVATDSDVLFKLCAQNWIVK